MAWEYDNQYGDLYHDGHLVHEGEIGRGTTRNRNGGYSGRGDGRNNVLAEDRPNEGPIPRGWWNITGWRDSPNTERKTIILEPDPQTNTHGRTDFRIHGDDINNDASEGCIILPALIRQEIIDSGDTRLWVYNYFNRDQR